MIDLLNSYGQTWLDLFGFVVLQNTAFIGLIFLALWIFKDTSAQTRYVITVIGLTKLLIPPFIPTSLFKTPEVLTINPTSAVTGSNFTTVMEPTSLPQPTIELPGLLLSAWMITALLYLLLAFIATLILNAKVSNIKAIKLASHKDINGVILEETPRIKSPLSIGFLPNKIFLPNYWKHLPTDCQEILLHHELAHIKRKDGIVQFFQIVAQGLYFFHPLVWLLNERINEYREMACDDTAISHTNLTALDYSRYLVHIAEHMDSPQWSYASASALIKQKNKLLNRVNYLIKEDAMSKLTKRRMAYLVIGLALLAAPLSMFSKQVDPISTNDVIGGGFGVIKYTIYDHLENPLKGLTAWAVKVIGEPHKEIATGYVSPKVKTDNNGQFIISNLPVGQYQVFIDNRAGTPLKLVGGTIIEQFSEIKWTSIVKISNSGIIEDEILLGHGDYVLKDLKEMKAEGSMTSDGTVNVDNLGNIAKVKSHNNKGQSPQITTGKIYGTVVDKETGEPMPGCNILVKGTTLGAATDKDGKFFILNVPSGEYTVVCKMMGYESVVFADVQVKGKESTELNFKIKPTVVQGETVKVYSAENEQKKDTKLPPPPPPNTEMPEVKFVAYDTPPQPIGGWPAIQKNLVYPELAVKAGVEGRFILQLLIDENGDIIETKVNQSLGNNGCDEAALNAVKSVKWSPAMQRERPVKVWVAVPVEFRMGKPQKNKSYDTAPEPIGGIQNFRDAFRYPKSLINAGISGRVLFTVQINESGHPTSVHVEPEIDDPKFNKGKEKYIQDLLDAATNALDETKWKPATQKGKPVDAEITIPMHLAVK